nr:MAG TPA: hypothetical protein [Caudoviricetes sp.]
MSKPLLLTSSGVRQQAIDAGLPPYAVAVIPGMLQPAGTLHTRRSARAETLYNSLEVDGAVNMLLASRFTQLIPMLTAPNVSRHLRYNGKYRWSGLQAVGYEAVKALYEKLNEWGVETEWTGITIPEFETTDKGLIGFMEALDGYPED